MISQLLSAIAQTLQTDFQPTFPNAAEAIVVSGGTLVLPKKLPYIRLLPGKVTFSPSGRDKGTLAPNSTQLLMVREFQQEFFVEIYEQSIDQLESWASLIVGILFASHDTLLQTYNQGQPALLKTEYAATDFNTLHTLNQIQLLDGLPISTESALGLHLRGSAIGQITITRTLSEGAKPVELIKIQPKVETP